MLGAVGFLRFQKFWYCRKCPAGQGQHQDLLILVLHNLPVEKGQGNVVMLVAVGLLWSEMLVCHVWSMLEE